nr:hypothetical protein HK105_000762 [Polyrhizophydium stewartii]
MSIDQTRHLFLLSPDDPKSAELPLIGLWFKLHSSSPLDPRVHAACLRYLANKRLSKLDTGKQNMLVCMFPSNEELADATARAGSGLSALRGFGLIKPKMFECFYEASAESVALFVTEQTAAEGEVECSFSRVDLASTSQIGLCRAVERRLGIRLRQDSDYSDEVKRARSPTQPTSPPPVLGADQDAVSAGGNCTNEPTEHLGDPSGDQINADISGMDSQMLYMSMLQRQIEMLQAQIAVLTTQPPPVDVAAMGTESPIVLRPPLNKAFSDPPRPVMLDAATNTSFMFDGGSACSSPERDASAAPSARLGDGEADSPRDELTTMMLESDLRRMHLTSISDALQPPADTGSNYAPVFDYANTSHSKLWTDEPSADRDAGPLERPSACDIIAELVSDPEKSFVFEGSAATAPAAVPAFAPAPASAPVGHEDPDTSVAHEPYSRATFEYLQKYGLLEAESVADSAFDDSLLQPAF